MCYPHTCEARRDSVSAVEVQRFSKTLSPVQFVKSINKMTEREDNVYKAKLAEQAERYDGKYINTGMIHTGEEKFLWRH